METIFMNGENSKTSELHRFILDLADKLNLKHPKKNMALTNLSIYYTWRNIKSACNNNKFKVSVSTWDDTFDLPDGSYSIADIQDYFEFIIKKHETLTENPPVQIYPNKIKNRIVRKNNEIVRKCKETYQRENVPKLESAKVVLVHSHQACDVVATSHFGLI